MEKLFEKATKDKLRFKIASGMASVEDLWDLGLQDLDKLAKALNKELKEAEEESFIKTKSASNKLTETKFELVKYIISVRMEEAEERKVRAAKAAKKAVIMDLIAKKEIQSLEGKSVEELLKEVETL